MKLQEKKYNFLLDVTNIIDSYGVPRKLEIIKLHIIKLIKAWILFLFSYIFLLLFNNNLSII